MSKLMASFSYYNLQSRISCRVKYGIKFNKHLAMGVSKRILNKGSK